MGILLHRVHAVPMEARRGHQIPPGTGVTEGCEPFVGTGNLGPSAGATNILNC